MGFKVKTNHNYRPLISGFELSDSERAEFDYIENWEDDTINRFVRYRGQLYDLGEFVRITIREYESGSIGFSHPVSLDSELAKWDGIQTDSFFSGIVVKYSEDWESVKVGLALC
jgi:hypothetical protein